MLKVLEWINRIVWGIPALLLISGVGGYLTIQTGFAQFRLFPVAFRDFVKRFQRQKVSTNTVSSYQALCTALAATVGTGNIAGVAGAIAIGGPGAIFWMWMCALLGMVTKMAEAALAVHYRSKNEAGEYVGGPMYILSQTLPRHQWLAGLYCFFGLVASFGVGNGTQINAVIGGMNSILTMLGIQPNNWLNVLTGGVVATLMLLILLGGAKRIGIMAERLVPFAALGYVLLCVIVLICRAQHIPEALSAIVRGAFNPGAMTGGTIGSVFLALRVGASRGVFTNEAGMGTAAIAHAAADVRHPIDQGLMGIMEVFLDTIVICTMTALVILCSGVQIPYGIDIGVDLTTKAFSAVVGNWICIPITIALCCFAVATVLGWGLYGIRCAQYLFGEKSWKPFVFFQVVAALISSVLGTGTVWLLSETVNGLMAIPNLIVLAHLTPQLKQLVSQYKKAYTKVCL